MGLLDGFLGGGSTGGMGILDKLSDPRTMALLQAAAGAFQGASGPNASFGRSAGGALSGLANGALTAQDMADAQIKRQQMQMQLEDQQRQKQALYGTPWTNPDTGQTDQNAGGLVNQLPQDQRMMAIAAPDEFVKARASSMFPKQGADTDPVQNAKFLFPNDPKQQAAYVMRVTTQAKENQMPQINLGGKWQIIPTSTGYLRVNQVTGEVAPVAPDGKTVMPIGADVGLASGKASAVTQAKAQGTAASTLPAVEQTAGTFLQQIDGLKNDPGKKYSLGMYSYAPTVPGTSQASFRARLDQVKGQSFLQAYNTLRGGGQITEVEGKKATDALGRLNTAQSEQDFDQALDDLKTVIQKGVETARKRAGAMPSGDDDLINKYLTPGQ